MNIHGKAHFVLQWDSRAQSSQGRFQQAIATMFAWVLYREVDTLVPDFAWNSSVANREKCFFTRKNSRPL